MDVIKVYPGLTPLVSSRDKGLLIFSDPTYIKLVVGANESHLPFKLSDKYRFNF